MSTEKDQESFDDPPSEYIPEVLLIEGRTTPTSIEVEEDSDSDEEESSTETLPPSSVIMKDIPEIVPLTDISNRQRSGVVNKNLNSQKQKNVRSTSNSSCCLII